MTQSSLLIFLYGSDDWVTNPQSIVDSASAVPLSFLKLHNISYFSLVLQLKTYPEIAYRKYQRKRQMCTYSAMTQTNATKERQVSDRPKVFKHGCNNRQEWEVAAIYTQANSTNEVQVCRVKQAQVIGNCRKKQPGKLHNKWLEEGVKTMSFIIWLSPNFVSVSLDLVFLNTIFFILLRKKMKKCASLDLLNHCVCLFGTPAFQFVVCLCYSLFFQFGGTQAPEHNNSSSNNSSDCLTHTFSCSVDKTFSVLFFLWFWIIYLWSTLTYDVQVLTMKQTNICVFHWSKPKIMNLATQSTPWFPFEPLNKVTLSRQEPAKHSLYCSSI